MQTSLLRLETKFLLPAFILAVGVFTGYLIIAQAQTPDSEESNLEGITFPIVELGNCASKDECRSYCNDPAHIDACVSFAESHGLMNSDEVERARQFAKIISERKGPGDCSTPEECRKYCSSLDHIDECINFAKEHGFKTPDIKEAEKIQSYIKAGGEMPGGCNSKESCEKYCGDFSHAEECYSFVKSAGITQAAGEAGREIKHFEKFLELAKNNETPGGCKSKNDCEAYCGSENNREECLEFAVKAGFMDSEQAEKIKKLGFIGPGSCNSRQTCEAYCNDPGHQEECFNFAREHGFISKEKIDEVKNGWVRIRAGLDQAPPEVATCLKSVLGPNIIEQIEAGNLTPGPEIGERVKSCFEKFNRPPEAHAAFEHMPSEVASCLREKFGDTFEKMKSGETMPTPEAADVMRVCFQKMRLDEGGSALENFHSFLRGAPAHISQCLREKVGEDAFEKLEKGEVRPEEFKDKIRSCFEEFRPPMPYGSGERMQRPEIEYKNYPKDYQERRDIRFEQDNLPPSVLNCVKEQMRPGELLETVVSSEKMFELMKTCMGQNAPVSPVPPMPPEGYKPMMYTTPQEFSPQE